MEHTTLIERILDAHDVSFVITGPWGEATHVSVALPDLRSADRSAWGDWGPMYSVCLPTGCAVEVSARASGTREPLREALDLNRLEIESPMLASTRQATPLVMKLPLPRQEVNLLIFYDANAQPVRVELMPITATRETLRAAIVARDTDQLSACGAHPSASASEVERAPHAPAVCIATLSAPRIDAVGWVGCVRSAAGVGLQTTRRLGRPDAGRTAGGVAGL